MVFVTRYILRIIFVIYLVYFSKCFRKCTGEIAETKREMYDRSYRAIRNSKNYVDKTDFIKRFLVGHKIVLITRPSKFGKSLNLDMLKTYVELKVNKTTGDKLPLSITKDLFKGKKIDGFDKESIYMGQFPVIYIDLQRVEGETYIDIENSIKRIISEEFDRHKYLLHDKFFFYDFMKEKFQKYRAGQCDYAELTGSLQFLSKMLEIAFNKNVYVLIDEYDKPIINAYYRGPCKNKLNRKNFKCESQRDKIVNLIINGLLLNALKKNDHLGQGLVMGSVAIDQEELYPSLKGIHTILTKSEFFDDFGFTISEVRDLLKRYSIDHFEDTVISWYGGYKYPFITESLFNPVSVTCFLEKKITLNYWIDTKGTLLLENIFESHTKELWSNLVNLIKGETIEKKTEERVDKNDLTEIKRYGLFYTAAVHYGYLNTNDSETPTDTYYEVSIPNKEVRKCFTNLLLKWLDRQNPGIGRKMKTIGNLLFESLRTDDYENVKKDMSSFFEQFLEPIIPKIYGDLHDGKKIAHVQDFIFLCFHSSELSEYFTIKTAWSFLELKDNNIDIRCDIGIVPNRLIFETKYDADYVGWAFIIKLKITLSRKLVLQRNERKEKKDYTNVIYDPDWTDHPPIENIRILKMTVHTDTTEGKKRIKISTNSTVKRANDIENIYEL